MLISLLFLSASTMEPVGMAGSIDPERTMKGSTFKSLVIRKMQTRSDSIAVIKMLKMVSITFISFII